MTGRRAALAAASVIAVTGSLFPGGGVTLAAAAPTTFTWSGVSAGVSGDGRTSTPGNWAGGVAPTPGQRVALVFPALTCVSVGACDHVVNDVRGLVVTSLSVSQPGAPPPGPYVQQGGYELTGVGLRLVGPVTMSEDLTTGPIPSSVFWGLPVKLGDGAGAWQLNGAGLTLGAKIRGAALQVVARSDGSLSVEPRARIDVEHFTLRGVGSTSFSSLYGTHIGAQRGTPVTLKETSVTLDAAQLGPLTVRDVELELSDPGPDRRPVSTVHGGVRLDRESLLELRQFTARHPSLRAEGPVRLGGAGIEAVVDCDDAIRDVPLTILRAPSIRGLLTDLDVAPLRDGAVFEALSGYGCDRPPRLRIDYSPQAITLTVLSD